MPLLHAAALALWAAALVCALLPVPPAPARILRLLHAPAALVALFGAIALFHRHPEQWFTSAGKARAGFLLMQAAIADTRARGAGGTIVNILSMNAHCGIPELAIYAATKGAMVTLTKNAAHAHMADRIRVNGINLGWVATAAERRMQAEVMGRGPGWEAEAAEGLPLGRLVTAEECARLAVFLLSDASVPMSGAVIDLEQKVAGAV